MASIDGNGCFLMVYLLDWMAKLYWMATFLDDWMAMDGWMPSHPTTPGDGHVSSHGPEVAGPPQVTWYIMMHQVQHLTH